VVFAASLHVLLKEKGLSSSTELTVPEEGMTAGEIFSLLAPEEAEVEAVFINGKVREMETTVFPGDEITFVPPGTPGPYRVFLGMRKQPEEK